MADSVSQFAWGDEENAIPPQILADDEQVQVQVSGTPVIREGDRQDGSRYMFLSIKLEVLDRPEVDLIDYTANFPMSGDQVRTANRKSAELQAIRAAFPAFQPSGTPVGDQEYPELEGQTCWIKAGVRADKRSGKDVNTVKEWIPAA